MNKRVKFLAMLAAGCMAAISLTACSNGSSANTPSASPQGTVISQKVKAGISSTPATTEQQQPQSGRQTDTYIGIDRATEIALADAALTTDQVTLVQQKQDKDDGVVEYDIDFIYENTEYEYSIDASTGSIRGKSQQPIVMESSREQDGHIGMEAAKQTALNHAGLSEGDVVITKIKLDYDDGRYEYEVEFTHNGAEYEYDIDATDGTILDFEMETSRTGVAA